LTDDRCSWSKDTGAAHAAQDAGVKLALDKESLSSYIDKMNYIRGESQKKQVAVVVHTKSPAGQSAEKRFLAGAQLTKENEQ